MTRPLPPSDRRRVESRERPRLACLATHAGQAGGAAIAMRRLVTALRESGGHVAVLSGDDFQAAPAARRRLERRVRRAIRRARTPLSNTLFTSDWPARRLAAHPLVTGADVVNLHWVAGLLNAAGIREIVASGRPVIWTLHDMRPFTGGCHYAGGCTGFASGCHACPQLATRLAAMPARVAARGRRALAGIPLTFVSPSRWLAREVARSTVFDRTCHAVRVIPNGLDLAHFAPGPRAAARRRLGLPEAGFAILLGSVSLAERRKAMAVAAGAVSHAADELRHRFGKAAASLQVITYGAGQLEIPGVACRHLGSVGEAEVAVALQASDLHLTMAREDNLPNTVSPEPRRPWSGWSSSLHCGRRPPSGLVAGRKPNGMRPCRPVAISILPPSCLQVPVPGRPIPCRHRSPLRRSPRPPRWPSTRAVRCGGRFAASAG